MSDTVTPPQFGQSLGAAPRRRHHREIGEGGNGAAVHHVTDGHIGGIPGRPQPDFVRVEPIGDGAELGDER